VGRLPALALTDGIYLWAWPPVARWIGPVLLLLGLVQGSQHYGYDWVFSESLSFILLLVIVGSLSAHAGFLFLAGFIVGDIIFFRQLLSQANPHRYIGALTIQYFLMATSAVGLPLLSRALVAPLIPPRWWPTGLRFPITATLYVLIAVWLAYCWVNSIPLLIRPMFTWLGHGQPTVQAMTPAQVQGGYILAAAAIAAAMRIVVQSKITVLPGRREQVGAVQDAVLSMEPVSSWFEKAPPIARTTLYGLWITLVFSGMYADWWDAALIFVCAGVLSAVRVGLLKVPLRRWSHIMEKTPLIGRLLAGTLLIVVLGNQVLVRELQRTNTFRPFIFMTAVALMLFFLLNPGIPADTNTAEKADR
jgi:hypothetical protein